MHAYAILFYSTLVTVKYLPLFIESDWLNDHVDLAIWVVITDERWRCGRHKLDVLCLFAFCDRDVNAGLYRTL